MARVRPKRAGDTLPEPRFWELLLIPELWEFDSQEQRAREFGALIVELEREGDPQAAENVRKYLRLYPDQQTARAAYEKLGHRSFLRSYTAEGE